MFLSPVNINVVAFFIGGGDSPQSSPQGSQWSSP